MEREVERKRGREEEGGEREGQSALPLPSYSFHGKRVDGSCL